MAAVVDEWVLRCYELRAGTRDSDVHKFEVSLLCLPVLLSRDPKKALVRGAALCRVCSSTWSESALPSVPGTAKAIDLPLCGLHGTTKAVMRRVQSNGIACLLGTDRPVTFDGPDYAGAAEGADSGLQSHPARGCPAERPAGDTQQPHRHQRGRPFRAQAGGWAVRMRSLVMSVGFAVIDTCTDHRTLTQHNQKLPLTEHD